MADLLTHVLIGYVLATYCSFRYAWIGPRMVTVAMVGSTIPDLYRISLLIDNQTIAQLLGVPFNWFGFHTLGGSLATAIVGVALVRHEYRIRVFLLLTLGAASHMLLDSFLVRPTGVTGPLFWPFIREGLPVPGFYLSTDRWPAVVSGVTAAIVWYGRYRTSFGTTDQSGSDRS